MEPTNHSVAVLPPKPGPKAEPTAPNLIASLIHPERKANIGQVTFSPDGIRLFTSGYPSGVVQIWDVASRKEIRRIETPPGYRGTDQYALLTPDWATLYVPAYKRSVKPIERDGKRQYRYDYSGAIRVWDVASGKEKEPLRSAPGSGPLHAKLAPDGRFLVYVEQPSYDAPDDPKNVTMVWDATNGKKWKLCDNYVFPSFAPDGKTGVASLDDYQAKTSAVKVFDLATGKELAARKCPEKDRFFSVGPVSPDGAVVAVYLGGKKGAPMEVWLLDAKTLEDRGKLIGKGDPSGYGWGRGAFTPDGKRFVVADGVGNILVWDAAGRSLERTLPSGANRAGWRLAFSPDGKTLAVGWSPKWDADQESAREPDPQDLPQPRVSLIDLAGKASPRVLIAPHGYVGALAFSPEGKTLAFGGAGAVHLFDLMK